MTHEAGTDVAPFRLGPPDTNDPADQRGPVEYPHVLRRVKLFGGNGLADIEDAINTWASSQPVGDVSIDDIVLQTFAEDEIVVMVLYRQVVGTVLIDPETGEVVRVTSSVEDTDAG